MSFQPNPLLEFTQRELKATRPRRPRKGARRAEMSKIIDGMTKVIPTIPPKPFLAESN